MEQFQGIYDAVTTAIQSSDWEKIATWGAYAVALIYGSFVAVKRGFALSRFGIGLVSSGTRKAYRFLNPLPPEPPEPSQLCRYLLQVLSYEDMVYDDNSQDLLMCGPVMVKLVKGTTAIRELTIDKDTPLPHLNEVDVKRVNERVKDLVDTYYHLKRKDTVQRMVNTVLVHMRDNNRPLTISNPFTDPMDRASKDILDCFDSKKVS